MDYLWVLEFSPSIHNLSLMSLCKDLTFSKWRRVLLQYALWVTFYNLRVQDRLGSLISLIRFCRPPSTQASAANTGSAAATETPRTIGEVEVNVEPIIVGIEMSESDGSRVGSVGSAQPSPAFVQGLMQMLNNSGGGRVGGMARNASTQPPASSSTNATPTSSGQDGQPTPTRTGGAQTQSTTSTNTRSSAHVHVAPLGPMSLNFPPMMMSGQPSFDPLLPCNSHHTNPLNRRTRHPAGPQAPQRRSSSMPPRNAANRAGQEASGRNNTSGEASNSARSSPMRRPQASTQPHRGHNFDFEITAHADIMPMIMTPHGMMSLGGAPTRIQQPPSRATVSTGGGGGGQERMEPSLAHLLAALQGEAINASGSGDRSSTADAGMFNVVMGVMNEINGNSSRTVSEFLERIPDYNYREGESLVTDLLMLIARSTSFADLVNFFQGSSDLNHLQAPLREFIRRYVLTPPNEDIEDIDAAVLYLVDSHFSHLEAMASQANVQADIDFAESVHSFLTANLSSLAETILRTPTESNFGPLFRQRSVSFLARLTTLCMRCFTDGHASLERVIRNRIEAMSGDYGPTLRDFVLSSAVAHFRNYLASLEANSTATSRLQNDQEVEQYFVRTGPDADQRRAARRRRLTQHQQAVREEETFVTPRSSPSRASPAGAEPTPQSQQQVAMDIDNDNQKEEEIVEPPSQQESTFPTSVSLRRLFFP